MRFGSIKDFALLKEEIPLSQQSMIMKLTRSMLPFIKDY
jgi:hypothetical protein